jgi:hypothetical protein
MKVLKLPLTASRIEEVRAMAYDAVDECVDTLIPFFEKEDGGSLAHGVERAFYQDALAIFRSLSQGGHREALP